MNILHFHKALIGNYTSYIQSFLNIKDPGIQSFVDGQIMEKKLWPEPLIQFNPTFESAKPISELCREGILHPEFDKIFAGWRSLYKHQEEAIRLGVSNREFVVTSGTGSGKSLTYMATIFNDVLHSGEHANGRIQAVVVYPMNALINSQFNEIKKFKDNYEERYGTPFPITFGQYTGQESEEEKERLRVNPPHILLTNYMMLELVMTRSGRDVEVRDNFLANFKFLVFDELHTYRGRQGSDVSILIRRIKASAKNPITCIGTSATMVSGETSTLNEQKKKVAEIASTIFGTTIQADQIVNEYLVRSLGTGEPPSLEALRNAVMSEIRSESSSVDFESHPTANWLEQEIALDLREGILVRRKPVQLSQMAEKLAQIASVPLEKAASHLEDLLEWANILNSDTSKKKNFLPYRVHQFIAQTGSVYSTLGDQTKRDLYLDAGRYVENKDTLLYPMVFSRNSGHEFICVRLNHAESMVLPREFNDSADDEDESSTQDGYVFIEHAEDQELVWDAERDIPEFPETWFNPPRRDGSRTLKKDKQESLPKRIWFNRSGQFSFNQKMDFEGWFIQAPLLFDPTSGTLYDAKTAEWTKVMKLGGEGRSTATTVLSFETITQLMKFGEPAEKQKLMSFTDNRQDASLQAGHFNDFVKVGQLRAAVAAALKKHKTLDYTNIADAVFDSLNLPQEQYARNKSDFPGPRKENEQALKEYLTYRVIYDLRRSWRVVLPNLEQCALMAIAYKYVDESVRQESLWTGNPLLAKMSPEQRAEFLAQVFDYFRKAFALNFSMLEPGSISTITKRFKEKLRAPWTLDDNESMTLPASIRLDKLAGNSMNLFTESGGHLSLLGRYIRRTAAAHSLELRGSDAYNAFAYDLFDFLVHAGWLAKKPVRNADGAEVSVYQLKVDMMDWNLGDGETLQPDLVKNRSYRPQSLKPNRYFQSFYQTNFHELKQIEGSEHTGQINSENRKRREDEFKVGKIGALFCSPTMELGIDISDLSIVHMRNVPPSPANYAQRSGRAGRSGQAALVMVYCSNYSAHDRHYFKHSTQMVAGVVTAPRIDLVNEELLISHLYASILTSKSIPFLGKSIGDLVNLSDLENLPLKDEIAEALKIGDEEGMAILKAYRKVIDDAYFKDEMAERKPTWYSEDWMARQILNFSEAFDNSLDRWRKLYRSAQHQIRTATTIIDNRVYADDHIKKKEAYRNLRQGERQRDLLLNEPMDQGSGRGKSKDQSEFYPYRYFASEGFLPGYNFTRLPVRSFMESEDGAGEYISRARFIALGEFGPRNVVYHDGAKYRVDRMMLTEAELKLEKGKICPKTGYFLYDQEYDYEVDPITNEALQLDPSKHIHTTLIELAETRAYQLQRINCQEEERTKIGYDIQTYFAMDAGMESAVEGIVRVGEESLLHVHYLPTARIFKLNFKWKSSTENGFAVNLTSGYWQSKKQLDEAEPSDDVRLVKLFTSDTANALYMQPVKALGLEGGHAGVVTLMYALKRAIENHFQVESNEIGATIMGDPESPNIFIYESSEGSLGILSQIAERPAIYRSIMEEAYRICFTQDGEEVEGDVLPATYDDLLSYYNQQHHDIIDRNLIRNALNLLRETAIERITNKAFSSYEEHYQHLQATRDPNSQTEDQFLKYLYKNQLRLPDSSQPIIDQMFVRPDFVYHPNVVVFCDGTPHDRSDVKQDDANKRTALKSAGYQVLVWRYDQDLSEFTARRPDIFKKVRE